MRPAVRNIILSAPAPIIPASVRPATMAWWDGAKRGSVWANLTNLVANGNFANGTTGWTGSNSTLSESSGTASITATGASRYPSVYQSVTAGIVGRKYYITFRARVDNANCQSIQYTAPGLLSAAVAVSSPAQNNWYRIGIVVTAADTSGRITIINAYADTTTASGKVMEVQNVMAFDITATFGLGNEPTAAEMDAILASEPAYWDGTRTVLANPAAKYYWQDYSGNGRHLKLNNLAYTTASGWNGDALVTDGVDDYAIRQDAWSAANSSFTTMAVFSVPNLIGDHTILLASNGANGAFPIFSRNENLTVYIYDSASGSTFISSPITANTRYYTAVVYDHSSKKTQLYINGVLMATSVALVNGMAQVTRIKTGISTADTYYSAQSVRALAAFNRALSAGEVAQIYRNNSKRWGC